MEVGTSTMTRHLWESILKSTMNQRSPQKERQNKRLKLIIAAKTLVYAKGYSGTTLADIAQEANVPLGNVYYYFKTKEAIGLAVIEYRFKEWETWKKKVSAQPLALLRLLMFLENFMTLDCNNDFGCPVGYLCQELAREGGPLGVATKDFLGDFVAWLEEQFRLLGFSNKAMETTLTFFSLSQGAMLLSHALQDHTILVQQKTTIERWLRQIDHQRSMSMCSKELTDLPI